MKLIKLITIALLFGSISGLKKSPPVMGWSTRDTLDCEKLNEISFKAMVDKIV